MRIAMLSYHTCPLATLGGKDTGGMNVYVRDLTRELGRHGIGVDVFTRSQDEHVPRVLHEMGYGNRVVHIPSGPEVPRPKEELQQYLPEFVSNVLDFAAGKNICYDLIHSHYWLSGVAALSLRAAWCVPVIHTFHTLAKLKNDIARRPEEGEPAQRIVAEHDLLLKVDHIITSTGAEREQFKQYYDFSGSNLTVIPPGVDIARFYPIPKDEARGYLNRPVDNRLILFVGRIQPLKGIDTLIEAIASLKRRGIIKEDCHICLLVIGGELASDNAVKTRPEMARLQKLATELGITDSITFLGKQDQDTLPYYYSAADAVVVPSHYESFGLVALEAMACGTPVVASDTGGLSYLIQDGQTGFHVPTADSEALANRLAQLLQNDSLRHYLGRNGTNYAREFAWPKIATRIIQLYESLLPAACIKKWDSFL